MTFYVIEKEFVGHADFNTGYNLLVNGHYFEVRDVPGIKNMSREVAIGSSSKPIWLGTSNEWSSYARGEYETVDAAIAAAIRLAKEAGHGYRHVLSGEPGAEDGFDRVYVGDEAWANLVDAYEWLDSLSYEEIGIWPGMSSLDIERLAEELEAISLHADECRLWGTEEFIRERLDELKEDLKAEED